MDEPEIQTPLERKLFVIFNERLDRVRKNVGGRDPTPNWHEFLFSVDTEMSPERIDDGRVCILDPYTLRASVFAPLYLLVPMEIAERALVLGSLP